MSSVPLLSSESQGDSRDDLQDKCDSLNDEYFIQKEIKKTTTANFLLCSNENTYYKGEIYKRFGIVPSEIWGLAKFSMLPTIIKSFEEFYSYKFKREINDTHCTFCVTFRKKLPNGYHVRLSLIKELHEEELQESAQPSSRLRFIPKKMKCRNKGDPKGDPKLGVGESLILDSYGRVGTPPVFSSITRGSLIHEGSGSVDSVVRNMNILRMDGVPSYIMRTTNIIKGNIESLGKLLLDHCTSENTASQGGATRRHTRLTRRRKGVFKRKGKKSYRKKKYGKTKKSRRFRRSVRSRR